MALKDRTGRRPAKRFGRREAFRIEAFNLLDWTNCAIPGNSVYY